MNRRSVEPRLETAARSGYRDSMDRRIAFEGIDNFRDFGGYATACGRGLKRGRLYRSAHHAAATENDLARLAELGVQVIVDLRRSNEREREPSRRWPGFAVEVIENDLGEQQTQEWHSFLEGSDFSPAVVRAYMLNYYRTAPTDPRYVDLYSRYFRALAKAEGPVLVHCAAGKDRTGMVCALTHHVAGVHQDDILHDYLLTNDPARIEGRVEKAKAAIREATGRTLEDEAVRCAVGVEPEYLAETFAALRARHGSIDGYLEAVLGLDGALRARIHERLLG